jgi:hypothetical protein
VEKNNYKELENFSFTNIVRIFDMTSKIDDKAKLSSSSEIGINLDYGAGLLKIIGYDVAAVDELVKYRIEILDYLKLNSIICDYSLNPRASPGKNDPGKIALINVNTPILDEFLPKITAIYEGRIKQKEKQNPVTAVSKISAAMLQDSIKKPQMEIVYEIKLTPNKEIFLNNFLLTKMQFNGENDIVFTYLYKHPNKTITKEELKKKTGLVVGKSMHKIVDNLSFTGNLRKVFFKVSEKGVLFRNPLTKEDMEMLNIPQLKLKSKAIL